MTGARDQILAGIRQSLKRGALDGEAAAKLDERIAHHARNLIPARTMVSPAERLDLFVAMATEVAATVDRLPGPARIPHAIADYLVNHNLPADIRLAPDPALEQLPWNRRPTLTDRHGRAESQDLTSVTGALAGIAETGTLMMASGPQHPTTLNLMPDNHIVVLYTDQIVGSYEEGWDRLRARAGGMPRTVNFITGPSRTGDIEQTIQLGAHGPRRLHILMVDSARS
jgi:L-lactate dehydrogenase complex protein LldG